MSRKSVIQLLYSSSSSCNHLKPYPQTCSEYSTLTNIASSFTLYLIKPVQNSNCKLYKVRFVMLYKVTVVFWKVLNNFSIVQICYVHSNKYARCKGYYTIGYYIYISFHHKYTLICAFEYLCIILCVELKVV